jgi:hypothetical protein
VRHGSSFEALRQFHATQLPISTKNIVIGQSDGSSCLKAEIISSSVVFFSATLNVAEQLPMLSSSHQILVSHKNDPALDVGRPRRGELNDHQGVAKNVTKAFMCSQVRESKDLCAIQPEVLFQVDFRIRRIPCRFLRRKAKGPEGRDPHS